MSGDPHNRTKHLEKSNDDEEEDPVEKMLDKAGCAKEHYAVQECMAETKDWRKCQDHVKKFSECIRKSKEQKL